MIHANDNTRSTTFISMFSGIEAASVAFTPLGRRAICFAEIEKFPSAVLAHHYPDVPNVGDMTAHDWAQYRGKVDVVCGGPPCQAFSVAGLRMSMQDARGNLSFAYMRALHAIKPRNAITENVPGWLNTPDNAFGCFLAGLVGADDALQPPAGRTWPDAGMVAGPKGRAAWRVLDAQFFGLAQRRRRVVVVADFGNGADPAAVLFERKGMFGNPAPRREAGEGVAGGVAEGAGSGSKHRSHWNGGVHPPLSQASQTRGGSIGASNQEIFEQGGAGLVETAHSLLAKGNSSHDATKETYVPEIARCVATREGNSQDYESTTMVAVSVTGDLAHTLKAEGHDASEDGTGRGAPIIAFSAQDYGGDAAEDIAPTLRAGGHTGSHANAGVMPAIAFDARQTDVCVHGNITQPLDTKHPGPAVAQTVALRGREGGGTAELGGDVATTLRASQGGSDKPHILTSAVRRLTPTECERLQGFPDRYTRIPIRRYKMPKITRTRPADQWECIDGQWWLMPADGPRYKALGNSWAVPKFRWVGERITRLLAMSPTVANDNTPAKEAA